MSVPSIQFPVAYEDIPAAAKTLREFIRGRQAEIEAARKMLGMVRQGCDHRDAKAGYNERDGSWMNPCPHCGHSY